MYDGLRIITISLKEYMHALVFGSVFPLLASVMSLSRMMFTAATKAAVVAIAWSFSIGRSIFVEKLQELWIHHFVGVFTDEAIKMAVSIEDGSFVVLMRVGLLAGFVRPQRGLRIPTHVILPAAKKGRYVQQFHLVAIRFEVQSIFSVDQTGHVDVVSIRRHHVPFVNAFGKMFKDGRVDETKYLV